MVLLIETLSLKTYISIYLDIFTTYFVDCDSSRLGNIATRITFTPEYAFPALIEDDLNMKCGSPLLADKQSDIFQMGLIYEVWCGKPRAADWYLKLDREELFSEKAKPNLDDLFCDLKEEDNEELLEIKNFIQLLIQNMVEPTVFYYDSQSNSSSSYSLDSPNLNLSKK